MKEKTRVRMSWLSANRRISRMESMSDVIDAVVKVRGARGAQPPCSHLSPCNSMSPPD